MSSKKPLPLDVLVFHDRCMWCGGNEIHFEVEYYTDDGAGGNTTGRREVCLDCITGKNENQSWIQEVWIKPLYPDGQTAIYMTYGYDEAWKRKNANVELRERYEVSYGDFKGKPLMKQFWRTILDPSRPIKVIIGADSYKNLKAWIKTQHPNSKLVVVNRKGEKQIHVFQKTQGDN